MKSKPHTPPQLANRFLLFFLKTDLEEEVLGDLEEHFYRTLEQQSPLKARLYYWFQVLNYLRPFAIKNNIFNHLNPLFMYQHHFKISWRTLIRDKSYSLINIGGLALGMAVTILIGLWIWEELSWDKNHDNYDNIAMVMQNQTFNGEVETWDSQALQLGPALRENYSNHFEHIVMSAFSRNILLTFGEKKMDANARYMEADAPNMLSLKMVEGSRDALVDINTVILAESISKALFGTQSAIGQTITLDNENEVQIGGVYEDLPINSSFGGLKLIVSWDFFVNRFNLLERVGWGNSWFQTFVQINNNSSMKQVSAAIKNVKLERSSEAVAKYKPELFLHPMKDWYLRSDFENGQSIGGRIQYIWLFGAIGVFVMLLACINFMNLSTARAERRSKEVGIRKTIGSHRSQLMGQFFTEALLVAIFAFGIGLFLVQLTLPLFNTIADKQISLPLTLSTFWMLSLRLVIIAGLLAGAYPALYLSSFHPSKVLKGTFRVGQNAGFSRKALVVVQFTVSIALIIGTLLVFQQIQYVKQRPIGYNNNRLVNVPIQANSVNQSYDAFKNDLLNTGLVENVAKSESRITSTGVTNSGYDWKGKDPNMQDEFTTCRVTHDFGKVINWQIKEGRDFSRAMPTDSMGFIINEAAARYMGLENPVGEMVEWIDQGNYKIIGVVKDMITQSPYQPVKQSIFFLDYNRTFNANIKIKPSVNMSSALTAIEEVYTKYDPDNIFTYSFVDADYARRFGDEETVGKLAAWFSLLAILISCLGVFGLAAYMAERRTKEIGIRKVLGASVLNIWQMLSKDFVWLALISCGIAAPIAYYYGQNWLDNFEYHIQIPLWIFGAASLGVLAITLGTVSFQALRAANTNPVQSLKIE